jgi:hypothetical protein
LTRFSRILSAVAVAVASLTLCAGASAKVVTVGSPLTQMFTPAPFKGLTTSMNRVVPELGANATSPINGVVVRWRILQATGGPFKLRVLRPAGGTSYIGVGKSSPEKPNGLGLQTFATALPIQAGDTIGLDNTNESGDSLGLFFFPDPNGPTYSYWEPQLPEGFAVPFKGSVEGFELAFNADVQPPPTVTSLTPGSGATGGGTSVTISGTDFEGASAVKFGATAAQSFTVNSESSITAVAPAGASGAGAPISVTTAAGTATSSQAFTYADPPAPPVVAATCKVPKLSGKTLRAAKKRIRAADCKVGKLTKRRGATAKDGEVVKQVPKPGATVPATTQVKVTLAPS